MKIKNLVIVFVFSFFMFGSSFCFTQSYTDALRRSHSLMDSKILELLEEITTYATWHSRVDTDVEQDYSVDIHEGRTIVAAYNTAHDWLIANVDDLNNKDLESIILKLSDAVTVAGSNLGAILNISDLILELSKSLTPESLRIVSDRLIEKTFFSIANVYSYPGRTNSDLYEARYKLAERLVNGFIPRLGSEDAQKVLDNMVSGITWSFCGRSLRHNLGGSVLMNILHKVLDRTDYTIGLDVAIKAVNNILSQNYTKVPHIYIPARYAVAKMMTLIPEENRGEIYANVKDFPIDDYGTTDSLLRYFDIHTKMDSLVGLMDGQAEEVLSKLRLTSPSEELSRMIVNRIYSEFPQHSHMSYGVFDHYYRDVGISEDEMNAFQDKCMDMFIQEYRDTYDAIRLVVGLGIPYEW